jgi:hypothetical protein
MDGSVGDVFGSRFLAKEDEDEGVHYDGGEHGKEDPEVVEPEAFDGVVVVDPALKDVSLCGAWHGGECRDESTKKTFKEAKASTYPCAGSDVEVMAVFEGTDCSHDIYKCPASANTTPEQPRRRSILFHNAKECMYSNRANEDAAGEISCRHKPPLGPTCWRSNHNGIVPQSIDIQEEGHSLLDIREQQIIY